MFTDAPKDITSPPSPREMLSPLKTMSPFTVKVLAMLTSVKLPLPVVIVLDIKMLAVTLPPAATSVVDCVPTVNVPIVNASIPPVVLDTIAAPFLAVPGVTFKSATSLPPPILITSLVSEFAPMNKLLD